ncbi:MAG: ABC transporter ATP-binding protein, partial [Achromobacter sp.]
MSAMLEVRGLEVNYGHIEAVRGIDLDLNANAITALVGANGAGKSTTLLALSGLLPKARGKVLFEGEDITKLAPHQIVARGIVQVAEGRAILTTMTVRENLELGAYRRGLKNAGTDLEYVFHLFPRLKERLDGIAGNLSGGEQQMLAIGRALMHGPKILLLDEPSMGLAPKLVLETMLIVKRL